MIEKFLQLLDQIRVCHWQTKIYGNHVALGDYYYKVSNLIDHFIEVAAGYKYNIQLDLGVINLTNCSSLDLISYLDQFCEWLSTETFRSTLDNIRQEILAETYKLKYLLELA